MSDHGLGRIYRPDPRDALYPMASRLDMLEPLPAGKVWYNYPVFDQGQRPTCVGWATEGWLQASPLCTRHGPTAEEIYAAAQQIDNYFGDGTSVRAAMKFLQAQNRVGEYLWATTLDELKRWVLVKGTVVIGVNWYQSMFTPDASGYVHISGQVAGGHALLVVGYTTGRKAYRVKNSWSASWGDNGRFWIHETDMQRLLSEQGEACAAIERRVP